MAAKKSKQTEAVELSTFAKKVQRWYESGFWNATMVKNAVVKGKITQAECDTILGEDA